MSIGSALALTTERVVAPVEGMHRVIAGRWFRALGLVGSPVRAVHDAVLGAVYGSIRLAAAGIGLGLDAGVTVDQVTTDSVQAWMNGLWGDGLGRHQERLAITMGIRDRAGQPIPTGDGLAAVFPAATGRVVVLLHGLVETERCWAGNEAGPGLAQALDDHPALTPVFVRYNTGLRVSSNGALLASLLEDLVAGWPVPVESLALVGHSMGGLVVRSACHSARTAGHRWIDRVSDMVTIGTPHRGAPLEKFTNLVAWGLGLSAVTRPLAEQLNGRSGGIKDLRFGAVVEDDWAGVDPDALLRNTVGDHVLHPGIDHHFIAGVVTAHPFHPLGIVVGDLWVRPSSSTAAGHLEPTNVALIGGVHHFDLLHEASVIDRVIGWLDPLLPRVSAGA